MNRNNRGRKPYPWTCSHCRKKAVYEGVTDYELEIEYEERKHPIKIAGLVTPRCRECGTVLLDTPANEQITLEFLRLVGLLNPEQVRNSREALNLTQQQLASVLGVAEATISRIESGVQFQERSLDNLLRLFFGVPKARSLLIQGTLGEIDLVARPEALSIS